MFSNTISHANSETVLSVEAGLKAESADRRLRYALTVFHYQLDDPQLTAVGGVNNASQLLNADRADGKGFELEFDSKLGSRWSLSGGLSYNHTAIRDPDLLVRFCGAPCTVTDPIVTLNGQQLASIDGNPLPYSPRWIGQLNLRYEAPLGTGKAYLQSDWIIRSSMGFFLYESEEFRGYGHGACHGACIRPCGRAEQVRPGCVRQGNQDRQHQPVQYDVDASLQPCVSHIATEAQAPPGAQARGFSHVHVKTHIFIGATVQLTR